VHGLLVEANTFWPTRLTGDDLREIITTDEMYSRLAGEATAYYEAREAELTPDILRQVERTVLLRIIDQRWRAHLYEMDYLREGINLRAMGQRDPLTEWQREGFEMFEQMMVGVWQDFVRYVMHVQVQVNRPVPTPADQPDAAVRNMSYSAPEDPSSSGGAAGIAAASRAGGGDGAGGGGGPGNGAQDGPGRGNGRRAAGPQDEPANVPLVKSGWDKTPRNAPCPCGSGKKYKLCHGR